MGISAEELAKAAGIGVATVRRAESGQGVPNATRANLDAIARALGELGVEIIDGGAPGVRLVGKAP